tara:strand:+ start:1098 stop:2462 length:1365 start_codon:yes stop_codon:yes gene_type:complete
MDITTSNMTLILQEDLSEKLSVYDDEIYSLTRLSALNPDNPSLDFELIAQELELPMLRIKASAKLIEEYELNDKTDYFSVAKKKYLEDYTSAYFEEKTTDFNNRIKNRIGISEKVKKLMELKLPEQRSKEWYEMRETILTASSLADAIGEGHFSTKEELILQKCGGPRGEVPFHIVEWGVMYEPVATKFYELMNDLTVLEFGLVPHPEFTIFGASPDGICAIDSPPEYVGRMLEIKCPPKRQFTKEVPLHYWMQMQGQLESCDLEECDFLQVKLSEYLNEKEWLNDIMVAEDGTVKEGYSSIDLPKGLTIAFVKNNLEGNPTIHYEYSEFYASHPELIKWRDKIVAEVKLVQNHDKVVYHWWKIERYECVLVGRDRKWWLSVQPKIIDFWEDVMHYREVGIQSLLDKKEEKKLRRIKLKNDKLKTPANKTKKNTFEISKEVVAAIQNNYLIDSD